MTKMRSKTTRVVRTAMRGASQRFWLWTGMEGMVPGAAGGATGATGGGAAGGWGWKEAGRIMTRVNSPGPEGWAGGGA